MISGRIAKSAALALLAAVLAGCGSSPKTSFYTLGTDLGTPSAAAVQAAAYSVAVGPVTIPEAVDRPQFVVRVAANQVKLLDQHHWAEPLKSQIPRVIVGNLARLLGITRVSTFPQTADSDTEYRVRVDIQRFESVPGDSVTLEAFWTVRRAPGGEIRSGRSEVRMPVGGTGNDALAAAHSRALGRMSEELAEVIRNLQATPR